MPLHPKIKSAAAHWWNGFGIILATGMNIYGIYLILKGINYLCTQAGINYSNSNLELIIQIIAYGIYTPISISKCHRFTKSQLAAA